MLELKLSARKILKGKTLSLWLLSLCPLFLLLCGCMASSYPLMSIFSGGSALFGKETPFSKYPSLGTAANAFLAAEGLLFLICAAGAKLYSEAKMFYPADTNQTRPRRFLCFSQGLRFLRCFARVTLFKILWAVLFFSPAAGISAAVSLLLSSGRMLKSVFAVWLCLLLSLLLLGATFYAAAAARYYMCPYLLYLNPLQSVNEIIFSSVLLTRGHIKSILFLKLNMLPWSLCSLFLLSLPFCSCYKRSVKARLCEKIYGENKSREAAKNAAVTFYVDKASRFSEKISSPAPPNRGQDGANKTSRAPD